MVDLWQNVLKLGKCVFCGDINMDRFAPNNPIQREELAALIPILEDFQEDNGVTLLNSEPTRYRNGHRPTLIDLMLTNAPQNFDNVENKPNITSEHELVKAIFH